MTRTTPRDRRRSARRRGAALEEALHEIKRVIVGQDAMLERLLVALLARRPRAARGRARPRQDADGQDARAGARRHLHAASSSRPTWCPPTSSARASTAPTRGRFDVELGPVFGNFLLADEINRAPAKVQSALLEVMQEQQVTIGGETFPVPHPFLVMATQNPIESEGTYPLPEAQVDRFLMKVRRRLPDASARRRPSSAARSTAAAEVRERLSLEDLERFARATHSVLVDREVIGYAVGARRRHAPPARLRARRARRLHRVRRQPARADRPRAGGARARAAARPRHVSVADMRDLAPDVLRHRIVLSYDAPERGRERGRPARARARRGQRAAGGQLPPHGGRVTQPVPVSRRPAVRAPGRCPQGLVDELDLVVARRVRGRAAGRPARRRRRARHRAGAAASLRGRRRRPPDRRRRDGAHGRAARAAARAGAHAHDLARARRRPPSMAFGTADAAEVRRRRGRRARARAPGDPPRRARRADDASAPATAAAAAARLAPRHRRGAPRAGGRRRAPDGDPRSARARPTRSCSWARSRRQPGLVVVISDFRDQEDWTRPLGALRARHSVLAIEVRDPREGELPPSATCRWSTPRRASTSRSTPRGARCASASPRSRQEEREAVAQRAAAPGRRARGALDRGRLAAGARAAAELSFGAPALPARRCC